MMLLHYTANFEEYEKESFIQISLLTQFHFLFLDESANFVIRLFSSFIYIYHF